MSKTVAITEGDRAYRFGKCSYLRTNKQGGGYVIWVPEDDRDTTTKHITKNGTYKISDEKKTGGGKYYGYSQVSVNVPNSGKAVGKKPDGNTHVVQPDANGDLTDKIIPERIKITTQPSTLTYEDGSAISKDGMVVKAYQGDGNLWVADGYSGGVIPNSELNLNPSVANYDPASSATYETEDGFYVGNHFVDGKVYSKSYIGSVSYYGVPEWQRTEEMIAEYHRLAEASTFLSVAYGDYDNIDVRLVLYDNLTNYVIETARIAIFIYRGDFSYGQKQRVVYVAARSAPHSIQTGNKIGFSRSDGGGSSVIGNGSTFTHDGKTVYYYSDSPTITDDTYIKSTDIPISTGYDGNNMKYIAWAMVYGSESKGGNSVTVEWERPDDLKILADTFNINVVPSR